MLGIENLKKEVDFGLAVMGVVVAAKKDGVINASDLGLLLTLIPVLGPAAEGLNDVVPELKDLSESEGLELTAYVVAKLAVDNAKAVLIVEKSLKFAIAGYELAKAIKAPAEVAAA